MLGEIELEKPTKLSKSELESAIKQSLEKLPLQDIVKTAIAQKVAMDLRVNYLVGIEHV